MAAPEIDSPKLYTARGTMKIYWVETLVDYKAPTLAELDAGVDLSPAIANQDGWTTKSSQIDAPNLKTRYTPSVAGEMKADDSSLELYMDRDGDDARDLMPRDSEGFIVRFPGGFGTGKLMDVFPVQTSSVSKMPSVEGSKVDTMQFQYAIPNEPAEDLVIPST